MVTLAVVAYHALVWVDGAALGDMVAGMAPNAGELALALLLVLRWFLGCCVVRIVLGVAGVLSLFVRWLGVAAGFCWWALGCGLVFVPAAVVE